MTQIYPRSDAADLQWKSFLAVRCIVKYKKDNEVEKLFSKRWKIAEVVKERRKREKYL